MQLAAAPADWLPLVLIIAHSQKTVRLLVAISALTGLLTVHVYSPASPRLAGLMTSEPSEMVILESAAIAAPPFPHWTETSVPAVHVQLREMFPPSDATEGTARLTPATAATERGTISDWNHTDTTF